MLQKSKQRKIGIAVKIKNIQLSLITLLLLVFGSFSFYTYAEERSITNKNIFLDSDQDGLSDEEEKTYGTDPHNADTDGDGYSDGAEVKSGYNPKKPSPGDRLIPEENLSSKNESSIDPEKKNLTKEVAQKVSTALSNPDSESKEITIDQVKEIVSESLQQESSAEELPVIDPKEIKVKKQDYGNLSKEKQLEKKKADFSDYIAGVSYVLLSNSPEPVSSNDDFTRLNTSITSKLTAALTTQNSGAIEDLSAAGEKTLAQIKDVEVPEEFIEDHTKGLQLAQYTSQLKNSINPVADDPLADLANYSKMQSLLLTMTDFSSTLEEKINEYDIQLDDRMQSKLENYGVSVPAGFLEEIK